jgi:hypothetical protein
VLDGISQAAHADSQTARRDAELLRSNDGSGLVFIAQYSLLRHFAFAESERCSGRIGRKIELLTDQHSGRVALEQKYADALGAGLPRRKQEEIRRRIEHVYLGIAE